VLKAEKIRIDKPVIPLFLIPLLYNGVGEKTGKKENQKKNFDMPLQ
jgi:hypothetical protein